MGASGIFDGFGGFVHDMGNYDGMYLAGQIGLVGGPGGIQAASAGTSSNQSGNSSGNSSSGTDEGGSDARWVGDRVVVTGWNDFAGLVFYTQNVLGIPFSMANYRRQDAYQGFPGADTSTILDDPNAFFRAVGKRFASGNMPAVANVFDYGVGYSAAGAVAAPVVVSLVAQGGVAATNAYLTNPTFWNGVIGGAAPAFLGARQPIIGLPTQTYGQFIGQFIGFNYGQLRKTMGW